MLQLMLTTNLYLPAAAPARAEKNLPMIVQVCMLITRSFLGFLIKTTYFNQQKDNKFIADIEILQSFSPSSPAWKWPKASPAWSTLTQGTQDETKAECFTLCLAPA